MIAPHVLPHSPPADGDALDPERLRALVDALAGAPAAWAARVRHDPGRAPLRAPLARRARRGLAHLLDRRGPRHRLPRPRRRRTARSRSSRGALVEERLALSAPIRRRLRQGDSLAFPRVARPPRARGRRDAGRLDPRLLAAAAAAGRLLGEPTTGPCRRERPGLPRAHRPMTTRSRMSTHRPLLDNAPALRRRVRQGRPAAAARAQGRRRRLHGRAPRPATASSGSTRATPTSSATPAASSPTTRSARWRSRSGCSAPRRSSSSTTPTAGCSPSATTSSGAASRRTSGIKPEWAAEAFADLDEDVRQSIARIKASPFIPRKDASAASSTRSRPGRSARWPERAG